mmetsp:Transcript_1097/g.3432  ORF Transcript_1097/g.3432 Transcript_1097/m.3432 type:complete len:211 (+) Transcript_1097:962-1594(+)
MTSPARGRAGCAVAAPFAFLGSIGVVAELPNVRNVLKRNDVDWLTFTAGKYKRTVTVFGENTDEAKAKFQSDIDSIHTAFKEHVHTARGAQLQIDEVATGEAWLALRCKELGLVDDLGTADDVILQKAEEGFDVVQLAPKARPRPFPWLSGVSDAVDELRATVTAALSAIPWGATGLDPTGRTLSERVPHGSVRTDADAVDARDDSVSYR